MNIALLAVVLPYLMDCPVQGYQVRVGYDRVVNPGKLAMNRGEFEKETGETIKWQEVPLSYKSMLALANDELDMTVANSVDIARAMTRQLPVKLVWILEELWDSEALVVHKNKHVTTGGPVRTPLHLIGRTIGVTFGGTEHYALEAYYKAMQTDILTNSLYQMTGCKYTGPPECQLKPQLPNITNSSQCKLLAPCHFSPPKDAVNFVGMQPEELRVAWAAGTIDAVYTGWQELEFYEKTGHVLLTSQELANWGKRVFHGLVASESFLARTDINAANFTQNAILTYAKANYYFENNTKEFMLSYAGKESVNTRIESVVDQADVYKKLHLIRMPTMEDQVTCKYLGCGSGGGIARALKDQAQFCSAIKDDPSVPKIIQQDLPPVQLADLMDDYSSYVTPNYINSWLDQGINGTYYLPIGARVHLGYQTTANYGRTTSLIIT